jgi:XTP/dITP diphosphohydrolase
MTLYCATTNAGKLREFQQLATDIDLQVLPQIRSLSASPETGDTFEANARQKAEYYGSHIAGWLFAEDSGLEVDALHGAPGIYSARWAGDDASNNVKLLHEMQHQTLRTARYVCVAALAHNGVVQATFRGTVEGEIINEARGASGFGYDPYFLYPPLGRSMAELSGEEKSRISHRGAAVSQLIAWWRKAQGL